VDRWVVILILGEFALIIAVSWIVANFMAKREQLRSEERLRIVNRFATPKEVTEFLESTSGRRLLDGMGSSSQRAAAAIVRAVRAGVILCFIGLGFLLFATTGSGSVPAVRGGGVVLLITGLGVIGSAFASKAMAKRVGLLPRTDRQDGRSATDITEP